MSNKLLQNVIIKGTKEGLTLHLDDSCSFQELLQELDSKLSANIRTQENMPSLKVRVHAGNRYLTQEQEVQIKEVILQKKIFNIEEIKSNVISRDEAVRMKEESAITSYAGIIRSGQVLEVPGDLLLVGDVNPGGQVAAGGNIFILGALKGIAHAGKNGREDAVITAPIFTPSMLKVGELMRWAPGEELEDVQGMECAYVEEGRIITDRLLALKKKRPSLHTFKGGL
ncbi:septum site-determining protein MinC [Peribacillus sp. SCS-37]|uniref:septum site-determining protein MinC n=1 Tax=Paraperibacillus esterisolvens TaxID=3115296 RepID=UPI0039069626